MSEPALLPIGSLSEATGVPVSALRYYDDIGLIGAAARVGGKRRFDPSTVGRVSFIRRAQDASFSLGEIARLLEDGSAGWRELVDARLADLTDRRTRLDEMISLVEELRDCGCESVATCPRAVVS